ncbi:spore germination protein GerPE [Paenibacillus herberti]|uniref:Spore germination protein GerPE n=1 Tax=Paenibacillus herberti TaxID=1619309 RepID=A0A229P487_9BACL|nr:spore germination protein GerPE [Paenibacillus herberti]OXM16774.1 hypothetical protein CGZ75_08995 [Paenibacillus herberti]
MIDSDTSIRTSYIGSVEMITVGLSSVIQFGDTGTINAKSTGIAVQRQLDHRVGGEVDFSGYSLFSMPFNPMPEESLDEADVRTIRSNPVPAIQLGSLYVITCSSSSILLGGSAVEVNLESRLKHFRQYAYSLQSTPTPSTDVSEIIQNADARGSNLNAGSD